MTIEDIPLTKIKRDPLQPRKSFPKESLKELADSMASEGLIQPITLRSQASGYIIVTGERRFRAARLLGWKTIRAIVEEVESPLIRSLIENLQREDLNPLEEAEGYLMVFKAEGISYERLAQRIGKTKKIVVDRMNLLKMPKRLQGLVRARTISPTTAIEISKINDAKTKTYAIREYMAGNLSWLGIRELQKEAREPAIATPRQRRRRPRVILRIPWLRIEITKY